MGNLKTTVNNFNKCWWTHLFERLLHKLRLLLVNDSWLLEILVILLHSDWSRFLGVFDSLIEGRSSYFLLVHNTFPVSADIFSKFFELYQNSSTRHKFKLLKHNQMPNKHNFNWRLERKITTSWLFNFVAHLRVRSSYNYKQHHVQVQVAFHSSIRTLWPSTADSLYQLTTIYMADCIGIGTCERTKTNP